MIPKLLGCSSFFSRVLPRYDDLFPWCFLTLDFVRNWRFLLEHLFLLWVFLDAKKNNDDFFFVIWIFNDFYLEHGACKPIVVYIVNKLDLYNRSL